VGFEPTVRLSGVQPISSRPRYDHFGTSPFLKESSEQVLTPLAKNASCDINLVVERKLVQVEKGTEGTPFLVEASKNEPLDARLDYGPSAHDARLLGYIEGTPD
jgi:hypothetical protein